MMYLSGTSMATPAVAGAAALMLQRNPGLTPNLVKAVLQYTAQPLAGFSTIDQGAGELNIEGAVRLAGVIKQSLSGLLVGSPLLVSMAPTQTTTIAGTSFVWGGGIIQKWNFITGTSLITKYQGIYGTGTLLSDGVLLSNGVLIPSGTLLSQGVMLSEGVMVSDGTMLASGTLLTQAVLLSDGTMLSDGVIISDGTLVSDSILAGTAAASASFALTVITNGDNTASMESPPDPSVE
jgi:acetyltransferase-like isoleucine patch superfamily enzyme